MFIVLPLLLTLSLPPIASDTDIKAPVLPVIAAAVTASVAPVSDVPPSTLVVAVPTSPPTRVGVADRVLDIAVSAASRLEDAVTETAPHVWRVMVRQQYAKAVGGLVLPAGMLAVVLFLGSRLTRAAKAWKVEYYDDASNFFVVGHVITTCAYVLCALLLLSAVSDTIMIMVNPEYYAMQDLAALIYTK